MPVTVSPSWSHRKHKILECTEVLWKNTGYFYWFKCKYTMHYISNSSYFMLLYATLTFDRASERDRTVWLRVSAASNIFSFSSAHQTWWQLQTNSIKVSLKLLFPKPPQVFHNPITTSGTVCRSSRAQCIAWLCAPSSGCIKKNMHLKKDFFLNLSSLWQNKKVSIFVSILIKD